MVQVALGGGWLKGIELDRLSDEAYFLRMRACGNQVRVCDDRYIGLLVGAEARGLPRLRGFRDIFHMAALQARMSRKKVTEVMRIARALGRCPGLLRLLIRAEAPWTKIRSVATIATPEWDAELCKLVLTETRKDIELWLRERARQFAPTSPGVASSRDPGATGPRGAKDAGQAAADPAPQAEEDAAKSGPWPAASAPAPTGEAGTAGTDTAAARDGWQPGAGAGLDQPGAPSPASAPGTYPGRAPAENTLAATLLALGIDALAVEKLFTDREALGVTQGQRRSLAWVLEQAIRAYRPSARAVRLPHLLVVTRCPDCRRAFVEGRDGALPVDDADAAHLRQSGATVDLDHQCALRGIAPLEDQAWPSLCRDDESACVGEAATPGRSRREPPHPDRPPVPARDVRFLMARQHGRCAFPRCIRRPSDVHHRELYDPVRGHDLSKMHLVCREHHRLWHTGRVENPSDAPARWRVRTDPAGVPAAGGRLEATERRYREHLHAAERRDSELAREFAAEEEAPRDELELDVVGGSTAGRATR